MNFFADHILSIILFFPALAGLIILFVPAKQVKAIRWIALAASLVPLILSLLVWIQFKPLGRGFQFQERLVWYEAIKATYHLGIDGISLVMLLLTTLLTPIAILASFSVQEKVKAYMILFLFLETGMLGVFLALDLLLFFVFWEIGLVPMYFLINLWGGERRNYASLKFMIYTMAGSLGLLLAIQLMGVLTGTFDIPELIQKWPAFQGASILGLPFSVIKQVAFWAFVVAFAIKVPVWPFHTWLPDAHTEAPTAGSMILAGVLLKLGAFGFLRLVLPLFPVESQMYAGGLVFLAVMAIVLGALGAFGQTDFKRLVAYSSINHMGFVVLGIGAAAWVGLTKDSVIALNGAVLQMFTHGLSSAGMFFLVGVIYDRTHTRNLHDYGGLWSLLPKYGTILVFTSMASLGLPGLSGFVSEFMVVRGAWPIFTIATAVSMVGLFFTGAYVLKALYIVLHGPINKHLEGHVTEINTREIIVIAPLMVLMLLIGVWPAWILEIINRAVMTLF